MHVHVNVCLTSLHHNSYTSMHGHVICMFMTKQKDKNPKLAIKGQTKQTNMEAETQKHKTRQCRDILYK